MEGFNINILLSYEIFPKAGNPSLPYLYGNEHLFIYLFLKRGLLASRVLNVRVRLSGQGGGDLVSSYISNYKGKNKYPQQQQVSLHVQQYASHTCTSLMHSNEL